MCSPRNDSLMNEAIISVGLVGYGLAGAVFHAPLIQACGRMKLSSVLTSRDAPHRMSSLEEVIEQSDLVVIASPHATHFPIAKSALEAGKHVVIDKPMTVSVEEADELIRLAAAQGGILSAFHNRRWDSDYLTVREIMPRLGNISLFEANWDRFRPALREGWRERPDAAGGLLNDLGPHMIDQALQLFGWPDAVEADVTTQFEGRSVDDYFALTFHCGRLRVCLRSSTLIAAPRPRFAIHGTDGSFVKFGLDPQETQLKAGLDRSNPAFGVDPLDGTFTGADGSTETVVSQRGDYLAYYEAIADAILEGARVPVTAEDARNGLALIDLARRASAEGRRLPAPAASSPAG